MHDSFSIIWGTRRISKRQIDLYLASAIKNLKGIGIKEGHRVAICHETSVEYIILLLALWRIKAIAAPINPKWPIKAQQEYTSRLGVHQTLKGNELSHIVCFDARHDVAADPFLEFDLHQEMTIIATSASSAEPKAALHTWQNHLFSAKGSNEVIPFTKDDRWLLSLPLFHVSGIGILSRCLISGGTLVISPDNDILNALKRGITHISLVATQLHRLLSDKSNHALLKPLKAILLGGSAIPQNLIDQCLELNLNVYVSYGLTEMSSQVATGKPLFSKLPCAKVLPYRELKIDEHGEILVRGKTLFKGYIVGQRIQLPLTADGWFKTGDIGILEDCCLTVTGRRDNMFICGGENVQPEEIEKAILSINGIVQTMVVPKEDAEFGFRPVAFVKFEGESLSDEHIRHQLSKDLPRFKIPTQFYAWPDSLIEHGIKISRKEFLSQIRP